jgi:hypothetical protein
MVTCIVLTENLILTLTSNFIPERRGGFHHFTLDGTMQSILFIVEGAIEATVKSWVETITLERKLAISDHRNVINARAKRANWKANFFSFATNCLRRLLF